MNFLQKVQQKAGDNSLEGVTVAFLGDSVTQGCFELTPKADGAFADVCDRKHGYVQYFSDWMAMLFPTVTVNIIHAGISGDNARRGLQRLERDVLRHAPDLVVVCYGLNDCGDSERWIARYVDALAAIFDRIQETGSEVIFLTPNMMNSTVSPFLPGAQLTEFAQATAQRQSSGLFDAYIAAAKAMCAEKNVPVCDCYAVWKAFHAGGVNTTELLANKINHPIREMHRIFAYELIKTLFTAP